MLSTVRQALSIAWRSLRTMRTALLLLLLMSLAAIAGSLIPQEGASDLAIERIKIAHPLRHSVYSSLGLFDVYGSWWFTLIYVLLLISLVACLIPRTRGFLRAVRSAPTSAPDLGALRAHAVAPVDDATPEAALLRARTILRRRGFRVRRVDNAGVPQLAARKGTAREGGSLLFHWALLLILVGVVWGRGAGFTGVVAIVEGDTWVEAHANYQTNIREGRFFNEDHSNISLRVDDFTAAYRSSGMPEAFITTGELFDPQGRSLGQVQIQPNHPAVAHGVRFYQNAYGYAPLVVVTAGDGRTLSDAPVDLEQARDLPGAPPVDARTKPWNGIVRLPSLRPQVAVRLQMLPDAQAAAVGAPAVTAADPVMLFWVYEGDLGLSSMKPINETDLSSMREIGSGFVPMGESDTVQVPGIEGAEGTLTVGFPELREYTVLQVVRDRGIAIMLVAALCILGGLFTALGSTRRRVWVQASTVGSDTVLEAGGYALQRRAQFDEQFVTLFAALAPHTESS